MNMSDRDIGIAALESDCAARALELVKEFARDGLSVPEQLAIGLNLLSLSICSGTSRDRWDDCIRTCCDVLRENVHNAVVS